MTDRNIQLLAFRYAEAMCPEESYAEEMKEQRVTDLQIHAFDAKKVIEWLSEHYTIMKKDRIHKVLKMCEEAGYINQYASHRIVELLNSSSNDD